MTVQDVTKELVRFTLASCDLPDEVRDAGITLIVSTVRAGASRAGAAPVEAGLVTARQMGGGGNARVFGTLEGMASPWAAFVNAMSAQLGLSSAHMTNGQELGVVVAAGVVTLADALAAPGPAVVQAVCRGAEVALRVHRGMSETYRQRGWDSTSTVGEVGVAAGAARLLGLDTAASLAAVGIAGSQAAGLRRDADAVGVAFRSGKAAYCGVEAAELAARGFTGPTEIIEGRRGLGEVFDRHPDYPAMVARLGADWLLPRVLVDHQVLSESIGHNETEQGFEATVEPVHRQGWTRELVESGGFNAPGSARRNAAAQERPS